MFAFSQQTELKINKQLRMVLSVLCWFYILSFSNWIRLYTVESNFCDMKVMRRETLERRDLGSWVPIQSDCKMFSQPNKFGTKKIVTKKSNLGHNTAAKPYMFAMKLLQSLWDKVDCSNQVHLKLWNLEVAPLEIMKLLTYNLWNCEVVHSKLLTYEVIPSNNDETVVPSKILFFCCFFREKCFYKNRPNLTWIWKMLLEVN